MDTKNRTKVYGIAAVIILAILSLSAYVFSVSNQKEIFDIEIPAIIFLTGNQAPIGEEILNSFLIAKKDFEEKNNVRINLIVEDSQDDPKSAISAYERLMIEDYPLVISTGDAVSESLAPVASRDETVLIATVAASEDTPGGWVFSSFVTSDKLARVLAGFISDKKDIDTVALMNLNNIQSVTFTREFKKTLEGIEVVIEETYNIADTDVKTQLEKIRAMDPDAIVVTGFGPAYPLIYRQAKELGIDKPIFADTSISHPFLFNAAGGFDVLDDVYYTSTLFNGDNPIDERMEKFVVEYKEISEVDPSYAGAFGYDTFMIAAETLLNCENEDSEKIKSCLSSLEYEGILGDLSFNSGNAMDVPLVIRHIKDGSDTIVKSL